MGKDKKNKKENPSAGDAPPSGIEITPTEHDTEAIQENPATEPKQPIEGGATGGAKAKKAAKDKKVKEKKQKEEPKKKEKKGKDESKEAKDDKKKDKKDKKAKKSKPAHGEAVPGIPLPTTPEDPTSPSTPRPETGKKKQQGKTETSNKPGFKPRETFRKVIDAIKGPDDPNYVHEPLMSSGNVLYVLAAVTTLVGVLLLIAGYTETLNLGEWGQGKEILIQRVFGIMFLGVGLITFVFKLYFEDVLKMRPRYNTIDVESPDELPKPTPGKSPVSYSLPLQHDPSLARMYLTSTPEEIEIKQPLPYPHSLPSSDITPEKPGQLPEHSPTSPDPARSTSTAVLIDPKGKPKSSASQGGKRCVIM